MRPFHFLIFILFAFTACEKDAAPTDTGNAVEDSQKIAEINNAIAWKIFEREQEQKPEQNVLISPWSIQTALNMALNGAVNETRSQLLDFMDCSDCSVEDLNEKQAILARLLADENGHPELNSVNAYFYDDTRMNLEADFENRLADHYHCSFDELDFNQEAQSLDVINAFVESATKGKIDKILDRIQSTDVAFLLNALHFKADWQVGFAPDAVFEAPFAQADGSSKDAEFVTADRNFLTFETAELRGVDLPLKDSTYSVTLVQPSANATTAYWHQKIETSAWLSLYDSLNNGRAIVSFPKLKMAYENDLIQSMKAFNVNAPFDELAADFSDMGTGTIGNIYISQIKHKAVLEMDEKGIEGAAVTSIGFSQNSLPPIFRFDSPYVLVVRHIETNTILFLAYVAEV